MNKVDSNNHKIRHVPSADLPFFYPVHKEVDSYNVHILLQSTISWYSRNTRCLRQTLRNSIQLNYDLWDVGR